jgi:hypothetical protein
VTEATDSEFRQVLLQLSLLSHVSSHQNNWPSENEVGSARTTPQGSPGGRRPSGGDYENPRGEEIESYRIEYEHHSASYFYRRYQNAKSDVTRRLILGEAQRCLKAWRRSPRPIMDYEPAKSRRPDRVFPFQQEKGKRKSWAEKMEIVAAVKSGTSFETVERRFNVSARSIRRYVKDYGHLFEV